MSHRSIALALTMIAGGCGGGIMTVPASGELTTGERFEGSATAGLKIGTFSVTSAAATCTGSYDPLSRERRMILPVTCTDGRTGTIDVMRDRRLTSGEGTVTFIDGTTGTFRFGRG